MRYTARVFSAAADVAEPSVRHRDARTYERGLSKGRKIPQSDEAIEDVALAAIVDDHHGIHERKTTDLGIARGSVRRYADSVYPLYPELREQHSPLGCSFNKVASKGVDIVFVHGLRGAAIGTWRKRTPSSVESSICWPRDWLPQDLRRSCGEASDFRVLTIGFRTFLSDWSGTSSPLEEHARG